MPLSLSNLKASGTEVTKQLLRQNASGLLRGYLKEGLEGRSTSEIYDYLLNADIWEEMPANVKSFLQGYAPWDLEWLTLDWLFKVIDKRNRAASTAIITSPELQQRVKAQIASLKEHLS